METKPRKWWVAGLLSLFWPGVGQVYNGQARKGIIYFLLQLLLMPLFLLSLDSSYVIIYVGLLVTYAIILYFIVVGDSIYFSIKLGSDYQLKKYNKIIIYIGLIVFVMAFSSSEKYFVRHNYVQAYKVPAASMEPTLLIGDHILVDRSMSGRNPKRGDIIVFEFPEDKRKAFVKRVVAVGGDVVAGKDKELYVNNKLVKDSYAVHNEPYVIPASMNSRDNFGPVTVPAGSYFVMGDNRDRSYDSRFWGCVAQSKIEGTVKNIYLSLDYKNNSVRWDRIGTKVK